MEMNKYYGTFTFLFKGTLVLPTLETTDLLNKKDTDKCFSCIRKEQVSVCYESSVLCLLSDK